MNGVEVQQIIEAGRAASLTRDVLTEWAQKGTPKQREYLLGLLQAEHASRQESRRQRLLRAARLPALKTLEGYDWSSVRFPADYGREALTSLDFIDRAQDLVLYGDVGTGKTPPGQRAGCRCLPAGHPGEVLHYLGPGDAAAPGQRGTTTRQGARRAGPEPRPGH
ncbi:ATP-binding protein [Zafaria sp. Z1313]|uniref:ATP-binding protein n=1 Tax=unclassified Zafaria TaxID=2828765 RepID=UPI002E77018D|nr:ATP-binding protein [Zafaria sp. J156]MEE1622801.1 ATP-binding protein [Zafaria sp. J156]